MKTKLELLGELVEEKEKALIMLQVQNQGRMKDMSSSSFGLNAMHLETEMSTLRELEAEVATLRRMYNELAVQTGQEVTGNKGQIVDFVSKKDDNCIYKLILIKEGQTQNSRSK